MNLELSPEMEKALSDRLARGIDADRIIGEGIGNVDAAEEALAAELQKGLDSLKAGRFTRISSEQELRTLMDDINTEIDREQE